MSTSTLDHWVSYAAAGRLIGTSPSMIRRLAKARKLTVRVLPGGRPRVATMEVLALALTCTQINEKSEPDFEEFHKLLQDIAAKGQTCQESPAA